MRINVCHDNDKLIMKFKRSLPYLNNLISSPKNKRVAMLNTFPSFAVDDLIEIIRNVSNLKTIKKHRKTINKISNTKKKSVSRKLLCCQSGGFIAAVLPIVMAVLGLMNFNT
jgi:hypothetical protein